MLSYELGMDHIHIYTCNSLEASVDSMDIYNFNVIKFAHAEEVRRSLPMKWDRSFDVCSVQHDEWWYDAHHAQDISNATNKNQKQTIR